MVVIICSYCDCPITEEDETIEGMITLSNDQLEAIKLTKAAWGWRLMITSGVEVLGILDDVKDSLIWHKECLDHHDNTSAPET